MRDLTLKVERDSYGFLKSLITPCPQTHLNIPK
jgi:hypothetical protein